MSASLRWPDGVLVGLASAMRTSLGPALLAVRGRITGKRRIAVLAMAAGELGVDKTPGAIDRTAPPAAVGRRVHRSRDRGRSRSCRRNGGRGCRNVCHLARP